MTTDPVHSSDPPGGDAPHSGRLPGEGPFVGDRLEEDTARVTEVVGQLRAGPRLQWPLAVVIGGLVVSLLIVAGDHFRRGSVLYAGFVGLAFVLRLVLSDQEAGWLAVRSRRVDLLVLGSLAGALTVFSVIVPSPS